MDLLSNYNFRYTATQDPIVNLNFHHVATQDPIVNYNFHHAATQDPIVNYNFHHAATQDPFVNYNFSPCGNSRSWSQHQICDTSFFLFNFISFMIGQVWLFVFAMFIVVSTSSVVWSQVRWFFLMRIAFHAINHDE